MTTSQPEQPTSNELTLQQRAMSYLSALNNGAPCGKWELTQLIREMLDAGWHNPPTPETPDVREQIRIGCDAALKFTMPTAVAEILGNIRALVSDGVAQKASEPPLTWPSNSRWFCSNRACGWRGTASDFDRENGCPKCHEACEMDTTPSNGGAAGAT